MLLIGYAFIQLILDKNMYIGDMYEVAIQVLSGLNIRKTLPAHKNFQLCPGRNTYLVLVVVKIGCFLIQYLAVKLVGIDLNQFLGSSQNWLIWFQWQKKKLF